MSGFDTLAFDLGTIPSAWRQMTTAITEPHLSSTAFGTPVKAGSRHIRPPPARLLWLLVLCCWSLIFTVDLWLRPVIALPFCYVAGLLLVVALPDKPRKNRGGGDLHVAHDHRLLFIVAAYAGVPGWVYLFNHGLAIADDLDRDDPGFAPPPRSRSDARKRTRRQRTAWRI